MFHSVRAASATAFAVVSLIVSAVNAPARAAVIFTGNSSGTFGAPTIDPEVDPDATFRTESPAPGSEIFILGDPGEGSMPNQLAFSHAPFVASTNQPFSVGNLSYLNGQTFSGTNVSSVPFNLELALNPPVQSEYQFQYQFTFNLTPNTTDDTNATADTLNISGNPQTQSFEFEDNIYSLSLLGFSQDEGTTFTQELQAFEDQTVDSQLFAQIKLNSIAPPTNPPTSVPEPALPSGLLLLSGMSLLKRHCDRKSNA